MLDRSSTGEPPGTGPLDVSVIMPNYNARAILSQCLASVYAYPPRASVEVIVVDDGSRDGSADLVQARFPQARLITNPRNRGQAYSNNVAARAARGRFLHFVNNDIEFFPGTIDELASFLDAHPAAGAAGSLHLNADGSLQGAAKPLPSARTALFGRRSYLTRWFPNNRFTRQELLDWQAPTGEPFQVGFVHGASLMMRRDVFFASGGFDEGMFNFGDADLCKRMNNLGVEVYCVPRSRVTHHEHSGGSGHSMKRRFWRVYRFHYDVWRYYQKHHSRGALDPINAVVIGGLSARFLGSLAIQLVREANVPLRGAAQQPVHRLG